MEGSEGIQYHLCSTYRGLWGLVVVQLSQLSGRALAAHARHVLCSTPGLFTFLYESFRITLTWSNTPSVSYCETFLSGSEVSSTIQDSFTKLRLAHIQRSKGRSGSAMRMRIYRLCYRQNLPMPILPRKCIIGPILITDLIIATSQALSGKLGHQNSSMKNDVT